MNTDLLKFIEQLSVADKKTLSQKGLKLAEECGELAKCILPYETAPGSLHKIVHKNQILENSVDSILVALSIAYSLGYTNDDIQTMMQNKATYWANLQQGESKVDAEKIPHEIHLTVTRDGGVNLDAFKLDCATLGVKPIVLDLHTKTNTKIKDIMTSSIKVSSTGSALYHMCDLTEKLTELGYTVLRSKLESVPWHPMVPNETNKLNHTDGCYFESHIAVYVDDTDTTSTMRLKSVADKHNLHISRNYFKRSESGIYTLMLTLREYTGTIENFKKLVADSREALKAAYFELTGKEEIEYCLYDSNVKHDKEWIK